MAKDFQSIMMTLQQYWADHGCLIWQPYYTQVGAGTMNPATSLRVLGPEPWNVGYVEPSIRPDDGRYGDNPNRLQQHYQFQVILKPDPGNPQELYLESLQAIGIDPRAHDIRFVEDNWESPALGAWGLGWEVWLDGQEITQFTYFQQAGGMPLNPVSVEITYGLERIAIALQRIHGFRQIEWGAGLTYGDVNLVAEREHSTYYFEVADVENQREMFEILEAEANNTLNRGLVLPSHDSVLKLSHTFNILDTRGAIGVTERQEFFRRMRNLSRRVSEAYVKQREEMGFPWLEKAPRKQPAIEIADDSSATLRIVVLPSPFILEIGTEELPHADANRALEQLLELVPALLDEQRLAHGEIHVYVTPRRLVLYVKDLAPSQPDREQVFRGPPAARAFDANGKPTRAAEGFARSKGLSPADLVVKEIDGGSYVTVTVAEKGRASVDVLADALPSLIASIKFGKSMRWNDESLAFSRPIRWIMALHGETPVSFTYAGLHASDVTRPLRFYTPKMIAVQNAAHYFETLQSQGIVLDQNNRKLKIRAQIEALAAEVGGEVLADDALLDEVTHLVEAPTALRGTFDEKSLELPQEVLVTVMKKHQRYFPVVKAGVSGGALLPYFITVRNGDDQGLDLVTEGNEHVIRARFADAAFFVANDRKKKLADYRLRLDTLTFQAKLGSMLDKSDRIESLVSAFAPKLGLTAEEEMHACRAAHLSKADLATDMVVEMTSLQGTIGRYYALDSGEAQAVADAIFEHYLPKSAGDSSPKSKIAFAVGLADRLDSLTGLFAVGLAPTGNKDPFGLRRAALGLVQMLVDWDQDFDLVFAIRAASKRQPVEVEWSTQVEVLEFIAGRLSNQLRDDGYRYDVVEAVSASQAANPASAVRAVKELSQWVARPDWDQILPTYSRCVRITRNESETHIIDPAAFIEEEEKSLYNALLEAETILENATPSPNTFLNAFLPMMPVVNGFFDGVLVMVDEKTVRANRLGLLQRISALASGAADMSKLEGF